MVRPDRRESIYDNGHVSNVTDIYLYSMYLIFQFWRKRL
jgi:hypothetical protein